MDKPDMLAELAKVARLINQAESLSERMEIADNLAEFIGTHHAELEAMARKSSRYDWLRDNGERMIGEDRGCGPEWTYGDDLDQAIDDAMRAEKSHD